MDICSDECGADISSSGSSAIDALPDDHDSGLPIVEHHGRGSNRWSIEAWAQTLIYNNKVHVCGWGA